MSCRCEFASGTDACEARNPAKPTKRTGRCGIPVAAEPEAMVEHASDAQADSARAPRLERGERLNAFLDAVVARINGIAEAATLEQGKILAEARAATLKGCAEGRFTAAQRRAAVGGALAQRDQAARTKGYHAGQRHGRRHADGAASQPRPSAGCLRRDRQGHCGAAVPQAGGRAPDGGHPYRPASGMRSANASQGRRKSSAPFFRLSSTTASTRRSRC